MRHTVILKYLTYMLVMSYVRSVFSVPAWRIPLHADNIDLRYCTRADQFQSKVCGDEYLPGVHVWCTCCYCRCEVCVFNHCRLLHCQRVRLKISIATLNTLWSARYFLNCILSINCTLSALAPYMRCAFLRKNNVLMHELYTPTRIRISRCSVVSTLRSQRKLSFSNPGISSKHLKSCCLWTL